MIITLRNNAPDSALETVLNTASRFDGLEPKTYTFEGDASVATEIHLIGNTTKVSKKDFLVQPANINSHEQVVVAGHLKAVEEVSRLAKEGGAKKSVMLPVSAPFHCPLMKPAELNLKNELEKIVFSDHQFPVISNVQAGPLTTGSSAREALIDQVCSPVRWADTMQYLINEGIDVAIELGTGKVLSGLMRRFNSKVRCFQIGDPATLKSTVDACKNLLQSRGN